MPKFQYVAMDAKGKETKGTIDVANQNEAIGRIKEMGLFPTKVVEMEKAKAGKKDTKKAAMFPSYLLVRCEPDPDVWHVISSTPGVTGFVSSVKTRPTALTRREVENIIRPVVEGVELPPAKRRGPSHEFALNDTVQIKTGPFATFSGHVAEINEDHMKLKVLVDIFGRETPVELDFAVAEEIQII